MSRRFFSADFHLGSTSILKYASRPWQTAEDAVDAICCMVNEKCDKSDALIHCGDFLLHGKDSHDSVTDVGLDIKQNDYLRRLKPNVFLLNGNHDNAHNAESFANNLWLDLNHNWKNVYVSHFPSYHKDYRGPNRCHLINHDPAIVLCGHVHDKWLLDYDRKNAVLNINVGIDVWNYKIVEDVQLTMLLDFIRDAKVKMSKDQMTSDEVKLWKVQNEIVVKGERAKRKLERYAKKCLTPEECERRKIAAMKSKGLIS